MFTIYTADSRDVEYYTQYTDIVCETRSKEQNVYGSAPQKEWKKKKKYIRVQQLKGIYIYKTKREKNKKTHTHTIYSPLKRKASSVENKVLELFWMTMGREKKNMNVCARVNMVSWSNRISPLECMFEWIERDRIAWTIEKNFRKKTKLNYRKRKVEKGIEEKKNCGKTRKHETKKLNKRDREPKIKMRGQVMEIYTWKFTVFMNPSSGINFLFYSSHTEPYTVAPLWCVYMSCCCFFVFSCAKTCLHACNYCTMKSCITME